MDLPLLSPPNLDNLLELDGYLENYKEVVRRRYICFVELFRNLKKNPGGLNRFTTSYKDFGINILPGGDLVARIWAPQAEKLYLRGDFNNWDRTSHQFVKHNVGRFSIKVPQFPGGHLSNIKIGVVTHEGDYLDRLDPWAKYVNCFPNETVYQHLLWDPPSPYKPRHGHPPRPRSLRIYECHVGIASPRPEVSTYNHFREDVLPRIARLGFNAIQIMAVMEHAYYACFGYQVTSFFAASSRFGTPDELKQLVDEAHGMGIQVYLDLVHSHASKNVDDGLNMFDGSEGCFFRSGGEGYHGLWDSRLFDYQSMEVLRFLLSNIRFWVEEFGFDGFRFDGITSMLYRSHGIGHGFSGHYDEYFSDNTDLQSILYLMIANFILHKLYPDFIVTIAEDVSGMPTLCRPVEEGGLGFDYRLAMAVPDMWIKLLKEVKDDDWDMDHIFHVLTNRRYGEKCIAYAESHDQAIVGDKSIAFWLMDREMYSNMSLLERPSIVTDRGLALHKLIRLITHSLGGEGYLNFIGNEFGHPEWLDFPRAGNKNSYHYARRQFNLVDDPTLRYKLLHKFECDKNELDEAHHLMDSPPAFVTRHHNADKVISFIRGGLVFIFNFSPSQSYQDYKIGVPRAGVYRVLLDSDLSLYGGYDRIDHSVPIVARSDDYDGQACSLMVYLPSRVAIVIAHQSS